MHLMPVADDGETTIARFRAHWHSLLTVVPVTGFTAVIVYAARHAGSAAGVLLRPVLGGGVAFAVVFTAALVLRWLTTNYLLTDQRLVRSHGILKRQSLEIPLTEIASIRASQNLLERILGYGDITVETAGDSNSVLDDIPRPKRFKATLSEARDHASRGRSSQPAPAPAPAPSPTVEPGECRAGQVPPAAPVPAADRLRHGWDTVARLGPLVESGVLTPDQFDQALADLVGDDHDG